MTTPKNKRVEDNISPDELKKIKQKLRAQAERDVLTNHRGEYNTRVEQLFTEHGLEFKRKLTEEEKAEQEMRKLITDHPELAARLGLSSTTERDQEQAQNGAPESFEPAAEDFEYAEPEGSADRGPF